MSKKWQTLMLILSLTSLYLTKSSGHLPLSRILLALSLQVLFIKLRVPP